MPTRLPQSVFSSIQQRSYGFACGRPRSSGFGWNARMNCLRDSLTRYSKPDKRGSPMLEWTGERFLPWLAESAIAYEHLHRYAYAASLVAGKRVLDLASGEGYGSKMLAESASLVIGVDIDENCVRHATARYGSGTLHFVSGSITAIPIHGDPFDVIVCFEAIEHIEDQERLLAEVQRLLRPDGIFIVSTPNK